MNYFYPLIQGEYSYNAVQKIRYAIGRGPNGGSIVGGQQCFNFDPPLTPQEETAVANIMNQSSAGDVPTPVSGDEFHIIDLWDSSFRADLEAELGFTVEVYFKKSTPELDKTDLIVIHFGKGSALSVQEKKAAEDVMKALILGWV